ncbi:MAG TPA: PD-(D/E)XK nuclease family protein [Thermoplasmata archaeon]|nr:PD-(D/E)XK nuclease family protein [Thermoplasmata archaeon]
MAVAAPLSYSSYRTYLECPLRWKYLYVDRLPETPRGYFTFGRVVHSVLEELLRPLVVPAARRASATESQRTLDDWGAAGRGRTAAPMSRDELLAAYDRSWTSEGYTSPEEEARYRALGRELLDRYYTRLERERPTPVSVEEHLEARWDGIAIHGYIDRIDRTPGGGLEIVDYKTSRELSREDARESEQLSIYQVLVESNYTEPVEGLTLYHLRSLTPLRSAPRPRDVLIGLYDRLGTVSDGIRAQAYEPTPGRHCSRCDFRAICPEFRTVPETDATRLRDLVDRFDHLRRDQERVDGELRDVAEQLHHAAEELGIHRFAGSQTTAVRRREEAWQYALEGLRPVLEESGLSDRLPTGRPEEVRRLVRDASVDPEIRRRVAETGARRVKWYWDLESPTASGRSG